jgi:hypothetical protein
VIDSSGVVISRDLLPVRFAPGAGLTGVHQSLTLATGNNTIVVPTGSIAMLLELPPPVSGGGAPPPPPPPQQPPPLILKGSAGDVGIPIVPVLNPLVAFTNPAGVPLLLPLGTSPTIVIVNNGVSPYVVDVTFV